MRLFAEKIQPYVPRHKWFAWYPVNAWDKDEKNLSLVWLEYVWRTNGYHNKWKYFLNENS